MMNRSKAFASVILLSFCTLLFLFKPEVSFERKKKLPENPGWLDQYFLMKKNEQGIIPSAVYKYWNNGTLNKKGTTADLDSIKEVGPVNVGGRTRSILIDKANPAHFLAGGVSGGLWTSSNAGASWSKINDAAPNLSVTSITQNPFNPSVIYYSTGESAGNSADVNGQGIFKSVDGGNTFTQLPFTIREEFEYIWDIVHSMTDSNTIYVGTKANGLYRSTDGGNTFVKLFNTNRGVQDIEVFANGKVMFSLDKTGVYRAMEPNPAFALLPGLPVTGIGRIEIAYCDSFPDVMYAQFGGANNTSIHSIYRTDDGGDNWTQVANPDDQVNVSYDQSWYCFLLGVKSDDPNRIVSGCVDLAYSTTAGQTWSKGKNSHSDYHIMLNTPNMNEFLVGNDGGIYRYSWSSIGSTNFSLNNNFNVTQFYAGHYFPTGNSVIGGTQDNGSHMSMNHAPSFKKLYGADGGWGAINQQSPATGYISIQYGQIMRSNNMTSSTPSFTNVVGTLDADFDGTLDGTPWFINPFEINTKDGSQLFFPTYRSLYRSNNHASTWEKVTNNIGNVSGSPSIYCVGISNEIDPTVYVGGSAMLLWRIDNARNAAAGSEKSLRNTNIPTSIIASFISCIKVHPDNKGTIYVALSSYSDQPRIWRVKNADTENQVWEPLGGDLPVNLPVNTVEVDPRDPDKFLIIGTDYGIYTSHDGGKHWEKESRIPNVAVHQIRMRQLDRKLFIFTHGRGIWTANVLPYGPHTSIKENQKNTDVITVSPNPSSNTIRFNISNSEKAKINIIDVQGRTVITENSFNLNENLSVEHLKSGVYFYKIDSAGNSYTGKFVKN